MFQLFIFFHGKRDGEKKVLYNIKKVVNTPIIFVFLIRKGGRIDKEEKGGGEIDQEGDNDPEFLFIINIKYGRVLYLLV